MSRSGFSLVELLVVLLLASLLLMAVLQVLVQSTQSFAQVRSHLSLQVTSRYARQLLWRDISSSGALGCAADLPIEIVSEGPVARQLAGVGSISVQRNNQQADSLTLIVPMVKEHWLLSDYHTPGQSLHISRASEVIVGQEWLLSDCVSASLFRVSSRSRSTISANTDLNHSPIASGFASYSSLKRLQRVHYSISTGVSGQLALYRQLGTASKQELLPNVEDLRVLGGVRDANGSLAYKPIAHLQANEQLVSVRVFLLLAAAEPSLLHHQTYWFAGQRHLASDLKLRRELVITAVLNNWLQP